MAKPQRPSDIKIMAGRRLEVARKALGVEKQEAFARLLGVAATTYNNWAKGERMPDVSAMVRLLDKCDIGPDWIYAGSLRGVPYDKAETLKTVAAEMGAVVGGAVAEWPMTTERRALPRPAAAVPRRAPRNTTFHERPSKPPG